MGHRRVLVKFRDRAHAEAVAIDPSANAEAAARLFQARGDNKIRQPDYRAHYDFHPNDPLFANQWNLSQRSAWNGPGTSTPARRSEVIVAVLDGGLAYDTATYRSSNARRGKSDRRRAGYPALGPG